MSNIDNILRNKGNGKLNNKLNNKLDTLPFKNLNKPRDTYQPYQPKPPTQPTQPVPSTNTNQKMKMYQPLSSEKEPVLNQSQGPSKFKDLTKKYMPTSDNENIGIALMFIIKLFVYLMSYFSLIITTNYMSNVYINDTLIEKKTAPSLINYGIMYIFINLILNSLVYFVALFIISSTDLNITINDILVDIFAYVIFSGIIVIIIANAMQSKKFFLYEDDGLRANRALKEIMLLINIILVLLPYNKLVK
jgi:hypothetical protein